jgi:hypothetical protein
MIFQRRYAPTHYVAKFCLRISIKPMFYEAQQSDILLRIQMQFEIPELILDLSGQD